MSSTLANVADAVTAEINLASWPLAFTAVRSWGQWYDKLTDLDTLHVDVVGVGFDKTRLAARKSLQYVATVDVAIRQRFTVIDNAVIDALVALLEGLTEWSIARRLTNLEAAVWEESDIVQATSRKSLQEYKQFSGFTRLKYVVTKALP